MLMRQLLLDLLPESPPSLDNFVPGEGNAETLAALMAWLDGGEEFCFLLWGASGSGKTHLLLASGFVYHDAAKDADLSALQEETPRRLVVDHVEALSEAGQIVLFHAFNRLRAEGGKLLVAARQAPSHLALREDLRTRLGSGWIYRLQPLTDAEKAEAMTRQAAERAMPLSAGMVDYLPECYVGRPRWDNWLIWETRRRGIPVVDASAVLTVLHQNHGYAHVPGGNGRDWSDGPETARHKDIFEAYPGFTPQRGTILHATHKITPSGLNPVEPPSDSDPGRSALDAKRSILTKLRRRVKYGV